MADQPKSFFLSPELHDYLIDSGSPIDEVSKWLIDQTATQVPELTRMQISPEQGSFMTLMTRALMVKKAIEIGTFTGYSSLCIARGLGPKGSLLCCDVSAEWTDIAKVAWARGGVAEKISLVLAPAIETLRGLPLIEEFDLAFIDADKESYENYYEEILIRLRPNGVIFVDNTLWSGAVLDPSNDEADTVALKAFNKKLASDNRVDVTLLTIGDGLTMARKRE